MRQRPLAAMAWCAALALGVAGCASSQPAEIPSAPSASATAPANILSTNDRTMVIDDGDRPPQLCVGGVAESLPPQCAGIDLVGWDWSDVGDHEQRGSVRWGEFVVSGEYSAANNALRVTATSADGSEPGHTAAPCTGEPRESADPSNVERIWRFVEEGLGVRVFSGGDDPACRSTSIRVAYDDGAVQSAVDSEFGAGAATVESALSPAR